jgi:hypothetical protein
MDYHFLEVLGLRFGKKIGTGSVGVGETVNGYLAEGMRGWRDQRQRTQETEGGCSLRKIGKQSLGSVWAKEKGRATIGTRNDHKCRPGVRRGTPTSGPSLRAYHRIVTCGWIRARQHQPWKWRKTETNEPEGRRTRTNGT